MNFELSEIGRLMLCMKLTKMSKTVMMDKVDSDACPRFLMCHNFHGSGGGGWKARRCCKKHGV